MKSTRVSKALTIAAFGARGTGKTAWVRQQIQSANPSRLMIWDFKHDPSIADVGRAYTSLHEFIRACKAPRFSLRFLPDHSRDMTAQFDLFCSAAWAAGDVLMFVDELPEVTKANRAPPAWRRCVNVGRLYRGNDGKERSISIIGAGQRPAECDKSFIGNADVIHTGRLSHLNDARELSQALNCDHREIMALPDLAWIERKAGQVDPVRGTLSFAKKFAKKFADPPPKAAPPKRRA